jgi:RHS repeat-associated protein
MSDNRRPRRRTTLLGSLIIALLLIGAAPFPGTPPATLPAEETPEIRNEQPFPENARVVEALPDVRRVAEAKAVGAGTFELAMQLSPESISRAFLVYELAGVPHWRAAVRSINGLPALGGFGAIASSGTALQIEEINPRWLRPGANQIVFAPAPAAEPIPSRLTDLRRHDALAPADPEAGVPYIVRNLRLVYVEAPSEPPPRLRLSYPVNGESDATGTVVRGFIDPAVLPSGPAELFVNEVYVPQGIDRADGSFAVFVPRTAAEGEAWEVRIEVVYPDGSRLRRDVKVGGETHKDDGDGSELDADAGTEKSLSLGDAHLDITAGALGRKVKLTMRGLRHEDLPALDAGMTNVTPRRRGFRLGPHGLRFKKPVRLRLPYDATLIPKGMTADDIRTFFFDEASGRWRPLPRVEEKRAGEVIVSATDHFTDFINATLALPEAPSGVNYNANSLKDLAKGEPASEIVQIAPPEGGASGGAALDFPIVVPPGRLAIQPNLNAHYDSGGGNGWLGVGWDLQLPSIEISTDFGVPRYDGTESYRIDGEQLAATSTPGIFVRRSEGNFDRIVRQGTGPTDYWWEVTDKNGTRLLYGRSPQGRLSDPSSKNIFRWYLEREIDLHGNTVDYSYFTDAGGGAGDGEPWVEVYPRRIDYTGIQGAGSYYSVTFALDKGNRPDRISSGRQGFKTYRRHRLASVDVLAGGSIVRRYVFTYRTGDFQKSLLASIGVTGEGATAELYRHTFDYVAMAAADNGDGVAGFSAQQAWGGMDSRKDFTASSHGGGGAHGFVGLGPVGCQPHGGIQIGGGGSESSQSVAFVDMNGDGLPDRITSSGDLDLNQYDPVADTNGSQPGHFTGRRFDNPDPFARTFAHTSEWNLDLGAGIHAEAGITAALDASWVWSHANEDRMLADIDGDQRPDLVSADGGFAVRHNTGHSFLPPSAPWTDFGKGWNLSKAGEETEVLSNFHLANPLRQLVLPYSGRVTLTGAIQKKEATGDGVDVAIYLNGTSLWNRRFAAGDTTACLPGPGNSCNGGLSHDVRAGDSLYFLAGSVRDTSGDALLWAPVISYDDSDPQAREPYGARTFVFDAGQDFRLGGYGGAGWSAVANGTVQITGALDKQETSDEVLVSVIRRARADGAEQVVFARNFGAAEQTTFDGFPAVTVTNGDVLFFRISSLTPIDPNRVQWTPTVSYQGATDPDSLPDEVRTQHAQVAMAIPRLLPIDTATQSWTPPSAGDQKLSVSCTADFLNLTATGTFYIQGVNRLVTAQPVNRTASFVVNTTASAGEPLFFTLLSDTATSPLACSVNGGTVPVNVRWVSSDGPPSVLSGGHHGWYYGEWNGNVPFSTGGLVAPTSKDDKPDFVAAAPRWDGTKGLVKPVWIAGGFDLYLAAEGVKPSRKGANAAGVLDQASGATSGGGLSVLRKTSSRTESIAASVGVGLALSRGWSDTDLDLIDMNGDRYPDQVSASGVRFSLRGNGFGPPQSFAGLDSAVRSSEDDNASTSVGLGVNFSMKSGKGKPKAVLNTMPSVGSVLSLSQTKSDLIDVNGDGLPDRVEMEPGSDKVTVRLNLGYRFGAPETWSLPRLPSSGFCTDIPDFISSKIAKISSLDTMNGLSFTRSVALQGGLAIGPFGGGVSTTLSRTLVELVDINGDGLPDRVAKDAGDGFFRVQLNLGDHWDTEQHWSVPGWETSIGDGYTPGDKLFHCLDAVAFSGHVEGNVSVGAPICIPLVPPIPILGLQIEISAQGSFSTASGMQLFLEDIDGDGLPDHILKKDRDGNVYVKRNQAARVNLLSAVHRPLGSTINLAYQRRGNTEDMPSSQWVLSEVSVADGRNAPYVTRYQYGNDGIYDQTERESYGFAHLRTILPDGSTIDRDFLNRDLYTRHLQTKEALADAAGNIFRVETSRYEAQPVSGSSASRFPALVADTTSFYEGTASAEKTTGHTFEYDSLGNIVRTTDLNDSGTGDNVVAAVAYKFDPDTRLTRPVSIEVRDGAGRLLRGRQGTYTAAGDLARLEQTLVGGRDPATGSVYSGTNNPVWTYTSDDLGNVVSATDPTGFTSTFAYDAVTRTHAVEIRDSFGYVTRFAYDLKYGELTETIDENGNAIRRAYDAFGRIARIIGPYDTDSAPTLAFEYGVAAPISWAVVHHKDATRSDPIDSAVFIDSLERVIETKEEAEVDAGTGTSTRAGMRVSGRVDFDAKGRVASKGQPIFDEHPASQFIEVPAKNATTFSYDALDRARTVRFPYGAVTRVDYAFGTLDGSRRFLTVRTDPNGHATRFYRDVHDNALAVEQTNTLAGARKTLVTRYAYDALDQLTAVTDAKGNTTRIERDTLGRTVTIDNPDLGRVESRYDPAGNLGAKINANLAGRGQQIRYLRTYNRLDRIDYPQSPDVVYTYGGPSAPFNRANRIATVTDASGVEERSYGKLGEVVQTVKTVSSLNGATPKGPYTTRYQYDSFDRLLSLVYPDGESLTYGYDAGGKVKSATGSLKGVRFDYLRHLGYDEFGERARMVFGNGVETRYTYDPASRFLNQLRTTDAGRDLQNLRYQHDLTGTMQALQNDVPVPSPSIFGGPITQTFQYDELTQLTVAQGTYQTGPSAVSTYTLGLGYDELGNIVAKNQLHQSGNGGKLNTEKKTSYNLAYAYGSPQPHAATRIGDRAFRYDADGNQIGWDSDANGTHRTLTWDDENRLASVADNGQTTRFLYDADGTRTNKAGPNGETIYVNNWFTLRNGAIASKHVFVDDDRLATKVSPDPTPPSEKVYFYQADHLGSTQFVTDEAGTVFQHLEYFPSGEMWVDERSETQRTPYLFSGKELDDETGLSYFGYRYYDGRQGQWISADPILDEMLETEKLTSENLEHGAFFAPGQIYGYVANDPTNLTDPDGLARFPGEIGQGGRHGQTSQYSQRRKVESNHFPAAASYQGTHFAHLSRRDMPAVTMAYAAHRIATSTGRSKAATAWRKLQQKLINGGKFHEAMRMDIENMFAVTKQKAPNSLPRLRRGIIKAVLYAYQAQLINGESAKFLTKYTKGLD